MRGGGSYSCRRLTCRRQCPAQSAILPSRIPCIERVSSRDSWHISRICSRAEYISLPPPHILWQPLSYGGELGRMFWRYAVSLADADEAIKICLGNSFIFWAAVPIIIHRINVSRTGEDHAITDLHSGTSDVV